MRLIFSFLSCFLLLLLAGCGEQPLNDYVPAGADFVGGTDGAARPAAAGVFDTVEQLALRQGEWFPAGRIFSEAGITPEVMSGHFLVYAAIGEQTRAGVLIRVPGRGALRLFERLRDDPAMKNAAGWPGNRPGVLRQSAGGVFVRIAPVGDSLLVAATGDTPLPFEPERGNAFALQCVFDADSTFAAFDSGRLPAAPPMAAPRRLELRWPASGTETTPTFSACYATPAEAAAMASFFQGVLPEAKVADGGTSLEFRGEPAEAVRLLPPGERRLRQLETVARSRELLRETLRLARLNNGSFPDDILESLVSQMTAPPEIARPFLERKYGSLVYLGRGSGIGGLNPPSRLPVLIGKPWEASGGLLAVGFADGRVEEIPLRTRNCRSVVQLLRARSGNPMAPVWGAVLENALRADRAAGF